jgi:hypothetical protein
VVDDEARDVSDRVWAEAPAMTGGEKERYLGRAGARQCVASVAPAHNPSARLDVQYAEEPSAAPEDRLCLFPIDTCW